MIWKYKSYKRPAHLGVTCLIASGGPVLHSPASLWVLHPSTAAPGLHSCYYWFKRLPLCHLQISWGFVCLLIFPPHILQFSIPMTRCCVYLFPSLSVPMSSALPFLHSQASSAATYHSYLLHPKSALWLDFFALRGTNMMYWNGWWVLKRVV